MKIILIILLLAAGLSPLFSEEIVFGFVPDSPPTAFIDEEGNPAGYFVELFSRIMDELDISYRYKAAPFAKLYPEMVSGDIQLFTALLKNNEREEIFYYPEIPAVSGWGQLFVAEDTEYSDINQLNGKTIGLVVNDDNGRIFKEFASSMGILYSVKEYITISGLQKGVKSGEVYAGVIYNISLS